MKVHCWLLRGKLSPYLDGEASASEKTKIEQHLRACASCRSLYSSLQAAQQTIRELPCLQPRETFSLALPAEAVDVPQASTSWVVRRTVTWVLGAAAVAVLVFAVSLIFKRPQPSGLVVQAYALDMGMYLDGVSQERSQLKRFAQLYESRPVSLEEAQMRVGFQIDAPAELPGGFSFVGAHLLKSGCCHAVRLRYRRQGEELDIFQQPKGHPVSFGSKPKFVPAELPQCQCARSGTHQAYYWETPTKGFVVVSALPEREVAVLVNALAQSEKQIH